MAQSNYNNYQGSSWIPYNLVEFLIENENIWKLLKYSTADALEKPNLTRQEKVDMIWAGEDQQDDFNVFLIPMVENIQPKQTTLMRIAVYKVLPNSPFYGDILIGIHLLTQTKLGVIKDRRARLDVLFDEIMSTLIGKNVGGLGTIYFNRGTGGSSECAQLNTSGNKKDYMEKMIILGIHYGNLGSTANGCGY